MPLLACLGGPAYEIAIPLLIFFVIKNCKKKEDLTSRKNVARLVTSKVLDRLHKPRRIIARLHMGEET